ncbi:serine/threonine-protein phosphatase with EF-hands 2-like isoform X2 [Paramacrobiotus metropolitanus]|uniref:serine/threonine-protein phosphatase with EF-hands 2-like isoform X2 n=1 Tax=Paramacrobiotus metropolitanus TaxID=2943436 RepID=UPI00244597EB|nr:serine/threonine-protein phosphatase with EF-hands 2-like isoform X2 [Paramacrobiotus metropolitanus]
MLCADITYIDEHRIITITNLRTERRFCKRIIYVTFVCDRVSIRMLRDYRFLFSINKYLVVNELPVHKHVRIHTHPAHCACCCTGMKAAMLIQRWYRRYKAQHDVQRQYTWTIFQKMEYANEQDHLKLQNFFNEVLSNKKLLSTMADTSVASAIELVKKRSHDHTAESEPELELLKATDYETIVVPDSYQGFRLSKPYYQNALEQLIESVKAKQRIHVKFVLEILHEARTTLKSLPNIRYASTSLSKKITVVGDLHGKIDDLLIIFYKAGLPDTTNPFVFNGDYVDRGFFSLEILLILLMALITNPNAVFLNRGNHEDHVMNLRYGFIKEISNKYRQVESKKIRRLIADVFSWMPVATIIDQKVFVTHGGVSNMTDIKLIQTLKRSKYISILNPPISPNQDSVKSPNGTDHEAVHDLEPQAEQVDQGKVTDSKAFLRVVDVDDDAEATFEWKQIVDLLWSDPSAVNGCTPNTFRGGGCYFGPDVSKQFMDANNLQYMIRSHECKQDGYEITHDGRVVTLFSASNYYEVGSNRGAFCRLMAPELKPHFVQYISTRGHKRLTMKQTTTTMEEKAIKHLKEQFFAHKTELLEEFEHYDPGNTGMVKLHDWCIAVEKILKLGLPWRTLRKRLVRMSPANHQLVDYYTSFEELNAVDVSPTRNTPLLFETLYAHKDNLEVIFRWMDQDNSGILTMEEFQKGCILLNKHMGSPLSEEQIRDLAVSLDINKDGQIEFNEFLEAFRLAETEDMDFEDTPEPSDVIMSNQANGHSLHITANGGLT